jgi:hypothetical protein
VSWLAGWQRLIPVILDIQETKIRRTAVQGQSKQIVHKTPIPKITREKWTGSVAQAAQHLLYKCKDLSSNYSPTKRKEESAMTNNDYPPNNVY